MTINDINLKAGDRELSPEEQKAAVIALDALQGAQSKIDVLFAYLLREHRRVNPCSQLRMDRKTVIDLGFRMGSPESFLVTCINSHIREMEREMKTNTTKDHD